VITHRPRHGRLLWGALCRVYVSLVDDWFCGSFLTVGRQSFSPEWGCEVKPQCNPRRRGHAISQRSALSLVVKPSINSFCSSTFVMPHFRKPKRPVGIAVSTPTPPAELVQHLGSLPRGDSRALAASSVAIALSIAFHDNRHTSGDGAAIRGRDTGWKTAYAAVRMAVETIKESSDMFLPLKAVVGALSVLMKNYDVSISCLQTKHLLIFRPSPLQQTLENIDGVKGIERRVQSLSGVLASPVSEDDYAEKGRRAELRRSVLGHTHICWFAGLLIPLSGNLRGSLRSLNHYLNNTHSLGSYAMLTTPKP